MKFYAKISYWDVLSAFYTTPNTSKNDDKNVINFYTYEYPVSELSELIEIMPPQPPSPGVFCVKKASTYIIITLAGFLK